MVGVKGNLRRLGTKKSRTYLPGLDVVMANDLVGDFENAIDFNGNAKRQGGNANG